MYLKIPNYANAFFLTSREQLDLFVAWSHLSAHGGAMDRAMDAP